jgi:hypothetical protein
MAKLELVYGEQILKQKSVRTLKGRLLQMGRGTLTNQRFVRQTQGFPGDVMLFGILCVLGWLTTLTGQALIVRLIVSSVLPLFCVGMLITRAFGGKVDIDLPLASITTLTHGKYGLNNNVFVIGTTDGQSYTLLAKFDPWFTAFCDALQTYTGATLVQTGEKQWAVQR